MIPNLPVELTFCGAMNVMDGHVVIKKGKIISLNNINS